MKRLWCIAGLVMGMALSAFGQKNARTVQNATELIAAPPSTYADGFVGTSSAFRATVILRGATNANDGFGGIFYWDPDSTATPAGTNYFKHATTNPGRWVRLNYPGGSGDMAKSAYDANSDNVVDNAFSASYAALATNALESSTALTLEGSSLATVLARASHTGTQSLSTLSQSGAAASQIPEWNGSAWVPVDKPTGGTATNVQVYQGGTGKTSYVAAGVLKVLDSLTNIGVASVLPSEITVGAGSVVGNYGMGPGPGVNTPLSTNLGFNASLELDLSDYVKSKLTNAVGSGGAPTNATYIVGSSDSTLSAEKVLTAGNGIAVNIGTTTATVSLGAITNNLDFTVATNWPVPSDGLRINVSRQHGVDAFRVGEAVTGLTWRIGHAELLPVINNTGSTITTGTPVYLLANAATTPRVALAVNTNQVMAKVAGLAAHNIADGAYGKLIVRGELIFDTSAWSADSDLFLEAVPGTMGSSRPTMFGRWQTYIGKVIVSGASGRIIVDIGEPSRVISTPEKLEWFGNGQDGDVVIYNSDLTLTRNMYYRNFTHMSSSNRLNPAGFLIFVSQTSTFSNSVAGAIQRSGIGGNDGSTGGTAGTGASLPNSGTLTGGVAGADGGAGGATNGVAGSAGTASTGIGGAGGSGGGGGDGAGGTYPAGGVSSAGTLTHRPIYELQKQFLYGNSMLGGASSGGGGGGGGGDGTFSGGGGGGSGAGAGIIGFFSRRISIIGTPSGPLVRSIGGIGGDGANGPTSNRGGAGGGGGGGGGGVYVVTQNYSGTFANAFQSVGGAGGDGGNASGTGLGGDGGQGGQGGDVYWHNFDTDNFLYNRAGAGSSGSGNSGTTGGAGGAGSTSTVSLP